MEIPPEDIERKKKINRIEKFIIEESPDARAVSEIAKWLVHWLEREIYYLTRKENES